MQFIASPASPFGRKVHIVLLEKGLPFQWLQESPSAEGNRVTEFNPLGKVPALRTDAGRDLFDSRVIVQYLELLAPQPAFLPADPAGRIEALRWEALADGCMDAMAATLYESRRPPELRSGAWLERQAGKIERALDAMAAELGSRTWCLGAHYGLADVAVGCALGFLDVRLTQFGWRRHPNLVGLFERLSARAAFAATVPLPA